MGRSKSTRLAADQLVCRQFQSIPPDRGMAAGKGQDQDSHHLRRGGRGCHRLGRCAVVGAEQDAGFGCIVARRVFRDFRRGAHRQRSRGAGSAGRLACAGRVRRHSVDLRRRRSRTKLRYDRSDLGITHHPDGRFRLDYGRRDGSSRIMAHPALRLGHRLCHHLDYRRLRGADEPAELRRIHDYLRRMCHGGDGDYFSDSRVHFWQARSGS